MNQSYGASVIRYNSRLHRLLEPSERLAAIDNGKSIASASFSAKLFLRGFTIGGGESDRLFEFDRARRKMFPSIPQNSGHAGDFYRVDLGSDVPANFVEERLADVGGKCRLALKEVETAKCIPNDRVLIELLTLVAMLAVRVPRIREQRSASIDSAKKNRATEGDVYTRRVGIVLVDGASRN